MNNKYETIKNKLSKVNLGSISQKGKSILKKKNLNVKSRFSVESKSPTMIYNSLVNKGDYTENTFFKIGVQNEIFRIRQEMREDIKSAGHRIPEIKNNLLTKWVRAINILKKTDIKNYLEAYRILGELFIEFGEYEHAKKILLFLKIICFNLDLPYELSRVYESLGSCYKFLNNYKKAIVFYKKQLICSWVLKDFMTELRCYDNIGIQYFYLNNRSKAKYYHNRMILGKIEQKTQLKQKVIINAEQKNYRLYYKENKQLRSDFDLLDTKHYKDKIFEILSWFDVEKIYPSFEDLDTVKMSEKLNDSTTSSCDLTFLILNDDYDEELESTVTLSKSNKFKKKYEYYNTKENEEEIEYPNISHLSYRRKEYNLERFEKIFERFDNSMDPSRQHKKDKTIKLIKSINKSYIIN